AVRVVHWRPGAVAGGVAGQGVQSAMNKTQGVELEIRKDDGNTIMVVQKQGNTRFSAGQRVVLASTSVLAKTKASMSDAKEHCL
ncbi:putative outer membrane lipoprotein, partial [Salmonella enterica subsp. enterica serovar Give str. S5-487]